MALQAKASLLVILVFFVLFLLPQGAEAAVDDPGKYQLSLYEFVPGFNIFLSQGTIDHGEESAIIYEMAGNIDVVTDEPVSDIRAFLFYLPQGGGRLQEYIFYDQFSFDEEYTWTKAGSYEVDIYGKVGASTVRTYLTTMSFTVTLIGGPAPTCSLTVTPDTIYPKQGGSALLSWSSVDADSASIDKEIGDVDPSGSLIVAPDATTTYTGTFSNQFGSVECSATLNVPDPVVLSLHEQAAALARLLVNQPDGYLWGGKGWDFDMGEFTAPSRILSGYRYRNPDTASVETGIGVDCSGLITWAFNRSYDAESGFNSNYIRYVNSDGMFRDHQSDPVDESDVRPGDTLSFDWDSDGRIDHVAMFVGESGGYDVVNASRPVVGIVGQINSSYKLTPGFKGFRRIHEANVELAIKTGSPVDIEVIDPDGNRLNASTTIFSDEEYIREVPGELYYLEHEQGHDGRPEDLIIAPIAKDGEYSINIISEEGADPTSTYSLAVEINGEETIVVESESIESIPEHGFMLSLSGGELGGVDPTIKVLLGGVRQTIGDLTLSSPQRKRNLLSTVDSAINWFDRDRTDQVTRRLSKLRNDVGRHITDELNTEELEDIYSQIDSILLLLSV